MTSGSSWVDRLAAGVAMGFSRAVEAVRGREAEIQLVISAFESVVPDGQAVFAAGPVSSGIRCLALLREHRVKSVSELITCIGEAKFIDLVVQPNLEDGHRFAAALRDAGHAYVIFTGPLTHPNWRFDDYIKVCFRLLENKCKSIHFNRDWEYSRGSVIEFKLALSLGLPMYSETGSALTPRAARRLLERAKESLTQAAVEAQVWQTALDALLVEC